MFVFVNFSSKKCCSVFNYYSIYYAFFEKRMIRGLFHKGSYERYLLYEFVELVLNYGSNEFVALKNL